MMADSFKQVLKNSNEKKIPCVIIPIQRIQTIYYSCHLIALKNVAMMTFRGFPIFVQNLVKFI